MNGEQTYEIAGDDHFVFGQFDVLSDAETFEQLLGLLLGLELLLPVKSCSNV